MTPSVKMYISAHEHTSFPASTGLIVHFPSLPNSGTDQLVSLRTDLELDK